MSTEKKNPAVSKMQIGSQRDPANKNLSPAVPKAVAKARTSETNIQFPPPSLAEKNVAPQAELDAVDKTATTQPAETSADAGTTAKETPEKTALSNASGSAPTAPTATTKPTITPTQPPAQSTAAAPATPVEKKPDTVPAPTTAPAPVSNQPAQPTATTPVPDAVAPRDPIGTPGVTIDELSSKWDQDIGDIEEINMDDLFGSKSEKEVVSDEIALESRVTGVINRIHRDDIFITLNGQHEGVVSLRSLEETPEIGSQLEVIVSSFNASDTLYDLRVPGATVSVTDWEDIDEGAVVEATITASNTGGLECTVNALRGFIPASQISRFRVEDLDEYIGKKLACVVNEANPSKRNLVLSHRAVMEREMAEQREQLLAELEVGASRDGIVTKLMDFGAFVDIGGIEGLVHISKLAWDRVTHPKDVLTEGQKVKVVVDKIDPDTGKIGLSYRDTLENPWKDIDTKYPVSAVVTGTVTRIANFGAFVKLEPGVEGLVHISELAHHRVHTVSSIVNEGEQIEVKVLNVDPEAQKLSLSLKETLAKPVPKAEVAAEEEDDEPTAPVQPKRTVPLKGGTSRKSGGGEQFGLRW